MRPVCALLALVVAASWTLAGDDASKADLKLLQGKWKVVSIVVDGEPQKLLERARIWVNSGNKTIYPDLKHVEEEFTIDAAKKPKEMDVQVRDKNAPKGEETRLLKAVYEVEANRFRICLDVKGKGRPTEVESKPGSGYRLITLERMKE